MDQMPQWRPAPLRRRRSAQLALVITGAVLASLVVLAVQRIDSTEDSLVDAEVAKLAALAGTRSAEIELVSEGYRQKADLVASRTRLRQLLDQHYTDPDPAAVAGMSQILGDAAASDPLISSITVVDLDGLVAAATDHSRIGRRFSDLSGGPIDLPAWEAGSRIHFVMTAGTIRLTSTAPMILDRRHIGTAVVTMADAASAALIEPTQFGESGEVLLGLEHPESGDYVYATPLRERAGGSTSPVVVSDPMISAINGESLVLVNDALDHAGSPVIAVTRHLPSLGWGLVAKVDHAEVAGQLAPIRTGFLMLGFGLALFGAAAGLMTGRRLEGELVSRARAEARFTSMFMSAPIALLLVDHEGIVRLANRQASQLLGYDEQLLTGIAVDSLVPVEVRGDHARLRGRFLADARPRSMRVGQDVMAVAAGDRQVPVEVSLTPIATDDGPMVVAALVDLSERKATQRMLEERAEALERSNRDLDAFAYVASHDLKAPLRAVANLAGFVLEDCGDSLGQESRDDLVEIQRRSNLLMQLLNGLLQYARVGREESDPVRIDVGQMLSELANLYVPEQRFELRVSPKLPCIFAPRPAAELVFRNLLMNAVSHHDAERGIITVEGRRHDGYACFVMADDGPGIPEALGEKVFQLFKTVDRGNEGAGSGMGLALVKRTIESHGGTVRIIPHDGRGAAFEIRWPLRAVDSNPEAATAQQRGHPAADRRGREAADAVN